MKISDFHFKKILVEITFSNKSAAEYQLLVDGDERIHYYKVVWKKVFIQCSTTKSHEKLKQNNKAYLFRINLLKKLNIEHFFSNGNNKKLHELSGEQIKIMNNFFNENWKHETFQNIIYVLTGCNPSGEGISNSANAKCNGNAVGFFLKCLNISTKKNIKLDNSKYIEEFNKNSEFWKFHEWIKSNKNLSSCLEEFNSYKKRNSWQKDVKKLENSFSKYMKEKAEIDKQIANRRRQFSKAASEKYPGISSFWKNNENGCPNYAHIKPVWSIRQKCEDANSKILDEINDINNCMPLTLDMHKYYDDGFLYWDINGCLIKQNEKNCKYDEPKNIDKFSNVPLNELNNIKKYLLDYINILKSFNRIS